MATPPDPLTRRARTRGAAALVGLVLVLAACGGDDGTPVASGDASTTTAAAGGEACTDLQVAGVLGVVGRTGDEQGGDAEEARAAMERLAASAPSEIAEPVATLDRLFAVDEVPAEDQVAGLAAVEEVAEWAAGACAADGPFWACATRSAFTSVGEAIGSAPAADDATPEAAAGEGEGERVEVRRTDDGALYAWLDERGLAVRSVEVVADDGAWTRGTSSSCNDSSREETFEPIHQGPPGTDVEGYGSGTDVEGYGTDVEGDGGGTDVEGYGTDVEGYGGGQ